MESEDKSAVAVRWSGQIAFVLAAAASAVGLGNLWRFPYLAARYGGGTFLCIYLALTVTLGFTLMVTEIALGRKTRASPLAAYAKLHPRWGFLGVLATLVSLIILPYYCVIGGWVVKYCLVYLQALATGASADSVAAVDPGFFARFIGDGFAPYGYAMAFAAACAGVVALGVKRGIEKSNLVMMPLLIALSAGLFCYVVRLPGALDGIKYFLLPGTRALRGPDGDFSFVMLAKTVIGAIGQMFYSLSLAMGIMITYGSYMRREDSIERSVRRIELFDSLVAVLAGLVIVPVVYVFAVRTGTPVEEAMNAGPGLVFITLPKVFALLGGAGVCVGAAFFTLVVFAAATSAISMSEACVAACAERLRLSRGAAVAVVAAEVAVGALAPALGYGLWSGVRIGDMQLLDLFDFFAGNLLMPVVAVLTCVFAGHVLGPQTVVEECTAAGNRFSVRGYPLWLRYLAPLLVLVILVSEICRVCKIGKWTI